ncbi:MAG: hypothetical protein ACXW6K_13890 [Candidatus Binatia bacterium]
MSELRSVEVCMAPGVVLTRPDASTMGNIVEQTILHDYLKDTSFPPPPVIGPPLETLIHWWDVGDKEKYLKMLIKRHPNLSKAELGNLREIRIPDISTWQGLFLRQGQPAPGFDGKRSELYEVKPDNLWGENKGREKIRIINRNYHQLGLTGYKWGTWYPEPPGPLSVARKQIHFRHYAYVIASFHYRIRRMERSLRAIGRNLRVEKVVLEIERRELGLLYYMICVKMTLDFNGEEKVAKKVIQRLFEAMTTGLSEKKAKFELEFANSLEPATRDRKPQVPRPPDQHTREAIRAIESEAEFLIRALNIVPELMNAISSLGQTLFSKLRGLPGERFIVCSDEIYFRNEILGPRKRRLAGQIAPLQVRPPLIMGSRLAIGGALVKVEAPIVATVHVILKIADDPSTVFTAKEEWQKALRWLEANPALTLVVGSGIIYGTALIVASAGAAGAVGLYAGGAVATAEGLGAGGGPGLARSLAGESLAKAALPAVEGQLVRLPVETARQFAAAEADALLTQLLSKLAQQETERVIARQAAAQLQQELAQKAFIAGGSALAAIAMRMAIPARSAGTLDENTASAASLVAAEVGALFLLPLNENITDDKMPLLCEEFDYAKFSHEAPGPALGLPQSLGGAPLPKKLRYLGLLACE